MGTDGFDWVRGWDGPHVPDLTPAGGPCCEVEGPTGDYACTRLPGHTGRHAAGNGAVIVAVWPSPLVTRFYISADGPELSSTWSVYREMYQHPSDDVPIDGTQEHVSQHATENRARIEAVRLTWVATKEEAAW